ncbi:MAG: class I SAM-dependent methyltransferase [Nocardioides sp.]
MNDKSFRNAQDMTRLEPGMLTRADEPAESASSIWRGAADAADPRTVLLDAVAEHFMSRAHPGWRLLEIGGGRCDFALRVGSRVGIDRITIMNTDAEVLTAATERGLHAHQGHVPKLPCSDNNFDVVVALWSLNYTVDLAAALADVHRVLRPGGRFLAVASEENHLGELIAEAGGTTREAFTSENGADALGAHFTRVTRLRLETRAVFADWQQAQGYLARFDEDLGAELPAFSGLREYVGSSTLFTCSSTNHPVPAVGDSSRRRPMSRPMRKPTGINHPGLTPPGLSPPGARPADLLDLGRPSDR